MPHPRTTSLLLAPILLLLPGACSTLRYDLTGLPFPVHATPAVTADGATELFARTGKQVLWVHGLLGEQQPDVAALLRDGVAGGSGVADFRAAATATFHDWLVTHLTLGFVRMKTVTVSGQRLPPR